jgi:hypothetical protein
MTTRRSAALISAIAAALMLFAVAPAAFAAPCGPAEMEGVRAPVTVDGQQVGRVEHAFVAGKQYSAETVIELAIGQSYSSSSPYRQSNAKPGSIAVTGPPGIGLTPVPESDSFRGGYRFTAPRGSSLTLTVTWVQQLQDQSGRSAGECDAAAQITRPIFSLKPASVSRARYVRHKIPQRFVISDDTFAIRVTPAPDPADPTPVYVILRLRGGRTSPPSLRARPVLKRRLSSSVFFRRSGMELASDPVATVDNGTVEDLVVSLDPFVRQGRTVRFGFSIEIVQGTKRLGGMRSGAICNIRFSSRAHRHYRACIPVGFKKHA